MSDNARSPSRLARRLAAPILLAAGLAAFFAAGLDDYVSFSALRDNRELLRGWVDANFPAALLVYALAYALAVAFSLPVGALATITGGFLFGLAAGTVATVIGATIGATALFVVARTALGERFRAGIEDRLARMDGGFRKNAFSYLLVLRLVPLFPFFLVNIAPAFANVRLSTYVVATALGIVPGTFVYTSVGNGLGAVFDAGGEPDLGIILRAEILLPILGIALLSLVPVVYRRLRRDDGGAGTDAEPSPVNRPAGRWDPGQYLRFGGHRLRPAIELLGRVDLDEVGLGVDMGCGIGDIARAMALRWPGAEIRGHDSSSDMLERARAADPSARVAWSEADVRDWTPGRPVDLLFANAVYQWVDGHAELFPRLVGLLSEGGVFAAQMPMSWSEPSHAAMRELLEAESFGAPELRRTLSRKWVEEADWYYDLLRPLVSRIDIWETRYVHVLEGEDPVLEWVKGTGLRPVLEGLDGAERDRFLALYGARLRELYPRRPGGETLFPFPRLFIVAGR